MAKRRQSICALATREVASEPRAQWVGGVGEKGRARPARRFLPRWTLVFS